MAGGSPPFAFQVVNGAFGMFTAPQSGAGEAIATARDSFVSPLNAVNPGDIVGFWGTGLGPVTGDETNAAVQADLASIPIEAFVGGKQAEVLFRGRNGCCSSVDTVYIRIPEDVAGCATPVMFKIGAARSNTVNVAVAASGRVCTPADPALDASRLSTLLAKPEVGIGVIRLFWQRGRTGVQGTDSGGGLFRRVPVLPGALGLGPAIDIPPPGSCIIDTFPTVIAPAVPLFNSTLMEAGPALTVTGASGQRTLTRRVTQGLVTYVNGFGMERFLADGRYTVAGPGDAGATANSVGAFSATTDLPAPIVWTNLGATVTVNRAQGVTINWTGGDPYGCVIIRAGGGSSDNLNVSAETEINCTARANAGTFSIPASILMALPPTPAIGSGTLSIEGVRSNAFAAPGLDFGIVSAVDVTRAFVTFR